MHTRLGAGLMLMVFSAACAADAAQPPPADASAARKPASEARTPAGTKAVPPAKPAAPKPSPPEKKPAPPEKKPAPAPPVPPPPPSPAEALRADLDRIFAKVGGPKVIVAARVIAVAPARPGDLRDGPADLPRAAPAAAAPAGAAPAAASGIAAAAAPEVLYSLRADAPLVPASTMKLVTTAACFDRLGPDWRLRTYVGRIPSSVAGAKWDLAVIGGGDPNFSAHSWGGDTAGAFRRWADVLKARGVAALGRVVLDDSLFDDAGQHPRWPADQRGEWYEAPVSALVVNDSCIDVHVKPGKAGEPAIVRVEPPGSGAAVDGVIQTVAERALHRYSIDRLPAAGPGAAVRLRVAGRFWSGAGEAVEYRAAVAPTMFFGSVLAETLREEGLAVAGPVARERLVGADGRARPDFACDVIHSSRLGATAAVANKRSQNLFAECLMKLLGAYGPLFPPGAAAGAPALPEDVLLPPRQGAWAAGAEEARRWMAERGLPLQGCVIDDGSGLSKENRLTALAVTELLRVMLERHGDAFVGALAAAGEDRSMANRLRGTAAEGRIWAKTGHVFGASALSGYVRARSGCTLIFSIIMNNVHLSEPGTTRAAQDKACLRMVEY